MRTRGAIAGAALVAMLGAGLAVAGAQSPELEPYKAEPVAITEEQAAKLSAEARQRMADEDPARRWGEKHGLMPVADYVNEAGETTAYVPVAQLQDPDHEGPYDLVTYEGVKIGEVDLASRTRPSVAEVNARAAEENAK